MTTQKFTEELLVESVGNSWILKRAFRFYYADKFGNILREIIIPEGFLTDFASTPSILYPIFPPIGIYNKAAMVHDYLYSKDRPEFIKRKDADLFFLQAMEVLKVPKWKRGSMFLAVRIFGRSSFNAIKKV